MQQEYTTLMQSHTWDLVNADESINKYKSQLVTKGSHQVHGFDFYETFYVVIIPITTKIIITFAFTNNWNYFNWM
uniref:Retrovirus-related Pol polyprotein from transposon TNT 1-94 n=1 Tax=Cajanus cajan TaxID=3821 RepID=A0A151RUZ9_CAJCA|nr:hypothetical protein KK1_032017 [Cajanus cajan]